MQSVTEQIKDRLSITEVLSSYIQLTPTGKQYKAKCPFHNERTASLSISPDRGVFYCFGCGAKGDIFTFVERFEGVDFNGALKILADRAGVALTRGDRRADDLEPLYHVLESATLRYHEELMRHPDAIEYLKGRGISDETIAAFRIGFAPDAWRFLADGYAPEERIASERAGLVKKSEKGEGYYDRFRSRIMFPIADSSGRVVGFSGRIFGTTEDGPKYLNSPETPLFQKSKLLFGFDKAKAAIRKHNFAILVEGQMDLVLSHQAGFRNTIATSGTAVSETSITDAGANLVVISKLTPNLMLAFDGDAAGQKALERAALVALALGMNPKVVSLPEGVDPADYISTNGADAWKELLVKSVHFITHQARRLSGGALSPHAYAAALRTTLFPYLARVTSPVEQNLHFEVIARESGLRAEDIARELELFRAANPTSTTPALATTSRTMPSAKERFVAFVEHFGGGDPALLEIRDHILSITLGGESVVLPPLEEASAAIALVEHDYSALDEAGRRTALEEIGRALLREFFGEVRNRLSQALREAEAAGDEGRATEILRALSDLDKGRHELAAH